MSELEHEVGILRSENLKLRNEVARLSQQTQHNQPQLTIPKSIADKLDDIFNEFVRERDSRSIWELLWHADEVDLKIGEQLDELLPDENQVNIGIAYLAGKALGVDLVKVSRDEKYNNVLRKL